jgi:hypothetical protein
LNALVILEGCIIRDFADKGVSVFHKFVSIDRCLIVSNGIGVSAKTDNGLQAGARIDRTTIVSETPTGEEPVPIGIQSRDKNGQPAAAIHFEVSNSVIRAHDPIWNDYPEYPERIRIRYTNLGSPESWIGEGNFDADPLFVDAETDFRLLAGSPCIDAGDPLADPDPDDTRADQGALPLFREECELVAVLGDYPESIDRGEDFAFDAAASNPCDETLALDEAWAEIRGPVSLTVPLHQGIRVPVAPQSEARAPVRGRVPEVAPAGLYTLCVSLHRSGELLDTACFQVDVR